MHLLWVLLMLFYFGWVCSAPDASQSLHLTVAYGQTVLLPCDGSAYLDKDISVQWEAMGSDVAAIEGSNEMISNRYNDRVHFASKEEINAGDWSISLDSVMLSDSDMYECILGGRRTLSTVWLTVEPPQVERTVEAHWDESVILPCYLDIPRTQSPQSLRVWWEQDGDIIFERKEDTLSPDHILSRDEQENYLRLGNMDKFPLYLSMNTIDRFKTGEYHCWYQTKESAETKPGIPGSINLIVLDLFPESVINETDEWGSGTFWPTIFWIEDNITFTESTTGETPVLLEEVTEPMELITEPLPMEAFDETMTSFPNEVSPETSSEWDDFPWVRTGLIAGVLLATAAVLCVLRVLHKL